MQVFTTKSPTTNVCSKSNLTYSSTSLTHIFSNPSPKPPKKDPARFINDNPWSPKTECHLSTLLTPLSQTTFFQTLRRIKTPSKALSFFKWAENSGIKLNPQAYFMMLDILGGARYLNLARNFLYSIPKRSNNAVPLTDKLFNSLIRSYGDAGLFQESMKVFQGMKSIGVSPSSVTFNSLFMILFKRGRIGMVRQLFDKMLRTYGAKPDLCTFNVLIRGFCMNSMVDEAFRMFRKMEKFDCEPDLITYNTIVDGLCRAGKVSIARNVVIGMQKKGENLRPNIVTYTTLIRGYSKKQEMDKVVSLFREMLGNGIEPNEITFNTIVQGLCASEKYDMIRDILNECRGGSLGFIPTTCTFNILMNDHCNRDNLDEALYLFKKMKELNVRPNSATYSMLIRAFCQKGNFDAAEELLDEVFVKELLLHDDGCTPLAAAYNPIFEYLCTNGKTKKAEKVFRQLMRRGVQDPPAYRTLVLGHCKEGTFMEGHKLLILMLRRYFLPDAKIYESLIEGLVQIGEPNLAHDTLERMLRSSYMPRTSVFHRILMELVDKGSAGESASLLMLMLDKNIRPNMSLSTNTVRILFKKGLKDKAFQLLRCLYGNGYIVNMKKLILFLCEDQRLLEAGELLAFSLKNNENADIDVCSTVLTGLCEAYKPSKAFELYLEILEKDVQQPLSCLQDLRNALEAEGKVKEAKFVAKRIPNLQLDLPG